jgi:hypothetical protein
MDTARLAIGQGQISTINYEISKHLGKEEKDKPLKTSRLLMRLEQYRM